MTNHAFNKGEWSEPFVFVKLIIHNRLFLGDQNHKPTTDYIDVISLNANASDVLIQILNSHQIQLESLSLGKGKSLLEIKEIVDSDTITTILNKIKSSRGGSFNAPLEMIEKIFNKLGIKHFKGGANSKGDFNISYWHQKVGITYPLQAVSIKSFLGSKPTLINPTAHTKFKYKVEGLGVDIVSINKRLGELRYKSKIQKLIEIGGNISFIDVKESVYKKNLIKVDSGMPKLLGQSLLSYFSTKRQAKLAYFIQDEINIIHVKRLLLESLLGIFPSMDWDGKRTCNGSISLLTNGNLLFYHVVDQGVFEDYLFNKTRFDSPQSRNTNNYCELYEENGIVYIDLILQIRFQ